MLVKSVCIADNSNDVYSSSTIVNSLVQLPVCNYQYCWVSDDTATKDVPRARAEELVFCVYTVTGKNGPPKHVKITL